MTEDGYVAWDSPLGRWLPTEPNRISPDGADYMTEDSLEIVDAAGGAVLHRIQAGAYNHLLGHTETAIYLSHTGMYDVPGIWKIDTSTGAVTLLKSSRIPLVGWSIADDHAAWGTLSDADNNTKIVRFDLASGSFADLYHVPGREYRTAIDGLTGSGVLLSLSDGSGLRRMLVISRDGSTAEVAVPASLLGTFVASQNVAVDGAVLFTGHGVAAYDSVHGLQVIVDTPDNLYFLGGCKRN